MSIHEARQAIPNHIGHYEILSVIGRGGMGIVYLARDPRLDRQVAIKCLRTELFEDHYCERFKREALLLAKLNHPHIVQIYDFIEAPEQLALVMEYVDGHNLLLHLREHLASFSQRLRWLTQIAQGLAIAHDAGIIHRDLKTENILINKRGIAKISDLGIAKSQDFNATLTDHVAGSYCSMSPEQAMGETINFKSDLFSLGILAYQLICGTHPFGETNNKLQLMQRIISHPPIPPTQHIPDLPTEIVNLLGQLLAKNPDNRPDDTHWVAAQFEKCCQLLPHNALVADNTVPLVAATGDTSHPTKHNTTAGYEHPTFDTGHATYSRGVKIGTSQKIYRYIKENVVTVFMLGISVAILGVLAIWQLQPKPPKYIAVIPPKFSTRDMPESQQELVKGAVYDAIQQSIIQLDDFHLIPREEIVNTPGDNEAIRRATAADEIITTEIICKIEACNIKLSRLAPENSTGKSRLIVKETNSTDVLTDNYLSVAETVQVNIGNLYSTRLDNSLKGINEHDYANFLAVNHEYRTSGESKSLLDKLDALTQKIKTLPAVQTLYIEIALDLHHETKEIAFLTKASAFIDLVNSNKPGMSQLVNTFQLKVAEGNFPEAKTILDSISAINTSNPHTNQLFAYLLIAQNRYDEAIAYYKKSLAFRKTADTLYEIAIAHLYSGDTENAMRHVDKSLELSPDFYNALSLKGAIALVEGDLPGAISTLEKIQQKTPDDTTNLGNLGFAYLLNKQYQEALKLFRHASTITPNNTTILLNMADAEFLLGKTQDASQIYQQIIDLQSQQLRTNETLRNTAQAYAHLHQYSNALTLLKELERVDPKNIETLYATALVHAIAKNDTLATLYIKDAVKNGMNVNWFNFPWFDALCRQEEFSTLMQEKGAHHRCTPTAE